MNNNDKIIDEVVYCVKFRNNLLRSHVKCYALPLSVFLRSAYDTKKYMMELHQYRWEMPTIHVFFSSKYYLNRISNKFAQMGYSK